MTTAPTLNWLELGPCRIVCADCLDVLPELEGVDAVITDPPYGIGHVHSGKARGKWHVANNRPILSDDKPFDPRPFLAPVTIMFGADHFSHLLPQGGIFHVWDKECGRTNRNDSFSDAEIFWTSFSGKRHVIRYMWKGLQREDPIGEPKRFHPTQKPVEVMVRLIEMTKAGTVLDPFMGSGTTGIACIRTGRKFIGIEKDPAHFATAADRIRRELQQLTML